LAIQHEKARRLPRHICAELACMLSHAPTLRRAANKLHRRVGPVGGARDDAPAIERQHRGRSLRDQKDPSL
jgi:hypothetical protein